MDTLFINSGGFERYAKGGDNDVIILTDHFIDPLILKKGTISINDDAKKYTSTSGKKHVNNDFIIKGEKNAVKIFEYVAFGTEVEWGYSYIYKDDDEKYIVGTSSIVNSVLSPSVSAKYAMNNGYKIGWLIHNHPSQGSMSATDKNSAKRTTDNYSGENRILFGVYNAYKESYSYLYGGENNPGKSDRQPSAYLNKK